MIFHCERKHLYILFFRENVPHFRVIVLSQAVGLAAKQGMIRNAINTVCNVKQVLGRPYDDPLVQATANSNSYAKVKNLNQ